MDRPTQPRIARRRAIPAVPGSAGLAGIAPPATERLGALLRRENGQAAVEFALVVPIICVLMVAFFDFARFIDYWFDMNRVASEGARIAAVNTGTGTVNDGTAVTPTSIKNRLLFDQKASSCVGISLPSGAGIGKPVTINVRVPFNWAVIPASIPFVGGTGGGSVTIRAAATMRQEIPASYGQTSCP